MYFSAETEPRLMPSVLAAEKLIFTRSMFTNGVVSVMVDVPTGATCVSVLVSATMLSVTGAPVVFWTVKDCMLNLPEKVRTVQDA